MIRTTTLHAAAGIGLALAVLLGCDKSDPTSPEGSTILLTANPQTIPLGSGTQGSTTLTATVFDEDGHTLSGVTVRFNASTGLLASNGAGVKTDSNGIARDTLTLEEGDDDAHVIARSGANESDEIIVSIGEGNDAPVARPLVSPSTQRVNQAVVFDGTSSTDAQGNNTIVFWKWTLTSSFNDARPPVTQVIQGDQDSTAQSFTLTFPDERVVVVTLQVTDDQGQSSLIEKAEPDLKIFANLPPIADAGSDFSVPINRGFTVSGAESRDDPKDIPTGGTIVKYDWNMGDGTQYLNQPTPRQTHAYTVTGSYTVVLTVWDNGAETERPCNTINLFAPCPTSKTDDDTISITATP